eukprot:gene38415-51896_t
MPWSCSANLRQQIEPDGGTDDLGEIRRGDGDFGRDPQRPRHDTGIGIAAGLREVAPGADQFSRTAVPAVIASGVAVNAATTGGATTVIVRLFVTRVGRRLRRHDFDPRVGDHADVGRDRDFGGAAHRPVEAHGLAEVDRQRPRGVKGVDRRRADRFGRRRDRAAESEHGPEEGQASRE